MNTFVLNSESNGMLDKKVGILGGGQLGKMLCQAGSKLSYDIHILDKDKSFPAGQICRQFTEGDFKNFDDVMSFGSDKDILTIEIEAVNTEALKKLSENGVEVYPQPDIVDIIKDKGDQKQFYEKREIPTSAFQLMDDKKSILGLINKGEITLPFVQKMRQGGYDGKGVQVIRNQADLDELFDAPSVIEELVDIDKELSVIVARNLDGEVKSFPPVEMIFNHEANLLDYQLCPANISKKLADEAILISEKIANSFGIIGLLAVELFVNKHQQVLVNEVAPRPHNSGHHTIEACYTSQYEQHLRAILNLPLGNTEIRSASVLLNVLGEKGNSGPASVDGLEACLEKEGVYIHLYGKSESKPFRKMGHVTILGRDLDTAIETSNFVKQNLKVYAKG